LVVVAMFAVVVVAPVVVVQPGSEAAGTEYYHKVTDMEKNLIPNKLYHHKKQCSK
jgi:hypothetical protein